MMEFYVSGQSLKFFTPAVAADSLSYLTAKVNFTDSHWDGACKWLHFRRGDTVYDLELDEKDEISADQQLNLTVGQWEIYLSGVRGETRLTTLPVVLTVYASGLVDAPLHELPMSVAEQLDFKAGYAVRLAREVRQRADEGEFKGEALRPLAYFAGLDELQAAVPEPSAGDSYGVGAAAPYDIYTWDGIQLCWVNNGPVMGPAGNPGPQGVSFKPFVDDNGIISWSNDGGLENPAPKNLTGPRGAQGEAGADGKSPLDWARASGYSGTDATFNKALVSLPYHNARHKPDGADPIIMQTGNYADASVTAAKLAENAVSRVYTALIEPEKWSGASAPYSQTVPVAGLPDSSRIIGDYLLSESWEVLEREAEELGKIERIVADSGSISVYAREKTSVPLNFKMLVLHGDGLGSGGTSAGATASDGISLTDRSTGISYSLYISDGKLTMA